MPRVNGVLVNRQVATPTAEQEVIFPFHNGNGESSDDQSDTSESTFNPPTRHKFDHASNLLKKTQGKGRSKFAMQWGRLNVLYDLVHKLRQTTNKNIELSVVYVCGSQSSGKTSLIENIMGQDLLPKGKNLQTRCPIELQLIRANCKGGADAEVVFDHLPDETLTDMGKVRAEIDKINSAISASGEVVRDDPIRIRLTSPTVWDLTLVDLPGLITKAVAGQDPNLPQRVEQLVRSRITNPKSIILVVAEATVDIAKESYALTLAQEVDPKGERTLGVLTKLDMMNKGDTAYDMLTGKLVHLEQGFIGVINRNPEEVKNQIGFEQVRERERLHFETTYPDLVDTMGIEYLVTVVGDLLQRTVSSKTNIDGLVARATAKLNKLGKPSDPEQSRQLLTNYLNEFKENYCAQVDGRRRKLDTTKLVASAKILNVFMKIFYPEIEALQGAENIPDEEIDIAVLSSSGLHSLDNIPDDAFQEFAKRDVARMKPIVAVCMKQIHELMLDTIHECTDPNMDSKYPMLNININRVVTNLINEHHEKCLSFLDRFMKVCTTFAHTSNADFLKERQELATKFAADTKQSVTASQTPTYEGEPESNENRDNINCVELRNAQAHRDYVVHLVRCYFGKVKEFVKDHVPNSIASEFVYAIVDNLNNALMLQLFEQNIIDILMSESNVVTQDRKNTIAALEGYKNARNVIDNMMKTNQ